MKTNTKSSITLPANDLRVVERLMERLGARSKVEVVSRALQLLQSSTDRDGLRRAFRDASRATRATDPAAQ